MAKSVNVLYDLVHCLSVGENRSFILFIRKYQKEEDPILVKLYEAIKQQKAYDEESLKKQLGLNSEKLSYSKHQLQQFIIDFLQYFDKGEHHLVKISNLCTQAQILIAKSQLALARKLAEKALKIAKENESYAAMPQIRYLMLFLINQEGVLEHDSEWEENLQSMVIESANLKSEFEMLKICRMMYLLYLKNTQIDSHTDNRILNDLMKSPYFKDESLSHTFAAKRNFYMSHKLYHHMDGNVNMQLFYQKKLIDLYEKNPQFLPQFFRTFLSVQFNYISQLNLVGDYAGALQQLEKVKRFPEKYSSYFNDHIMSAYETLNCTFKLNTLMYLNDYSSILELILKDKGELEKHSKANEIHYWEYNLLFILSYFFNEEYEGCFNLILAIENEFNLNKRPQHYFTVKSVSLLAQYELYTKGKFELEHYESSFNALYFYSRKHKLDGRFHKAVLKLLRKLRKDSPKDLQAFYKKIRQEIQNNLLSYKVHNDGILCWLESKINNTPLKQVVKERKNAVEREMNKASVMKQSV